MNPKLINFVSFQAGWFACVLGAANGMPWLGALLVCLIVAVHIKMADRPRVELQLLLLCVILGLIFDSFLVSSGWVVYPSGVQIAGVAPYWILAMWALFSTTINLSMAWLKSNLVLASVMGAFFGPLSYIAGQRLGAIELIDYRSSLIALAVIWAVAMPIITFVAGRYDRDRAPVLVPLQRLSESE